jgi:hypothetical protein
MKMKLTHAEFCQLYILLSKSVNEHTPKGMEAIVIHSILKALYRKFYLRALDKKKHYVIKCEDHEACAFYMFFSRYPMEGQSPFTVNLFLRINNFINQKFAV